tara:strand:+ start:874 stop:1245 length:372 start_codon:yes stop_codon:yes gene_type:complete
MSKLLETRLPIESNEFANRDTFNRLVRILEINLGTFDPDSTPQYNDQQISTLAFSIGDVIWNTSIGVLQVYIGNRWIQLHTPANPQGYELQASVGSVSIETNGNVTVSLTSSVSGWNIENWYS